MKNQALQKKLTDLLQGRFSTSDSVLNNFSKALAMQGKIDKVSVSIIHPGMTLTSRLQGLLDTESKIQKKSIKNILQKKCKGDKIKRPKLTKEENVKSILQFLLAIPITMKFL